MAISCTLKITAFHLGLPVVAQWVNVLMNAAVVYACYVLGRMVGLSRSHRLLCGTAMLGYVLYGIILLFVSKTPDESVSVSVLGFFVVTMIMSVWFLIDLVRSDIKKTEEDLKKMEKELEQ